MLGPAGPPEVGQVWLDIDYRSYYHVEAPNGRLIHCQRRVLIVKVTDEYAFVRSFRNGRTTRVKLSSFLGWEDEGERRSHGYVRELNG